MPGSKIPILTVEKFWLEKDGRGLYVFDDGAVCSGAAWTGVSGGALECSKKFLPAVSAQAWLKVTRMSGTSGGTTVGYIPIFNSRW